MPAFMYDYAGMGVHMCTCTHIHACTHTLRHTNAHTIFQVKACLFFRSVMEKYPPAVTFKGTNHIRIFILLCKVASIGLGQRMNAGLDGSLL